MKRNSVFVAGLLIATAVYARFLAYGHISWDDPEMVFRNRDVKTFAAVNFFTNHYVGNYIPLTMSFHALGWLLFGSSDWGHHLLNILFHLLNGLLVLSLGRRLFRQETVAAMGAVVFLLHPLQVESVGWIAELKNVVSTTFYLSSLIAYLSFSENKNVRYYFLSLLLFVLGCLCKPSVVILPLALIAADYLFSEKVSPRLLLNKAPFLAISILFGIINIKSQAADLFINHAHEFAYYQRAGMAGVALLNYGGLFALPFGLSAMYPYPALKAGTVAGGILLLVLTLLFAWYLVKIKNNGVLFILLFIVLNLALVLQLLPFGEVLYADRYAYVPLIGAGWALGVALKRIKLDQPAVLYAIVCLLGALTFLRTDKWKSALSLYEDILKKYPDQFVALNSAGVECMFMNNDAKALEYLTKATRVAPNNYKSFYNRGLLLIKNNKPREAIHSFNQAIALYEYPKAYVGRATAYYLLGDFSKAMNDATHVLSLDSNNSKAHFVLANCYNDLNRLDEAMKEYNTCIEQNSEEADYFFKRAIVWGKKQDFKRCLDDLELCLYLNAELFEAYYWKGVAKMNLGEDPCSDLRVAAQKNFEPAVKAYQKYCQRQ